MNNHDYPLGSDTPDAPWNASDPIMKECPTCNGVGMICNNCEEDYETCTCEEEDTRSMGHHDCSACEGSGEVEADPEDYEPDYDDIDD